MKAIRLGNDIEFVWTVEGLTDVLGTKLVQLFNVNKGIPETMTYEISGDNISGLYKGKDQKEKGSYRLILYVNRGENDMVTLDCVNAFELVGVSNFGIVNGSDESAITIATINLRSTLDAAPVIPSIQAQSDWEQDDNTKVDFIKNKPTLFSGDYEDLTNKPTIPDAQIQSDWNQSDSTKKDYIKNKPNVPSSLSELSGDSTHRTVTDAEKSNWNGKSDFSGNYNDLTNKPSIPVVPTKVSAFINDVGYVNNLKTINGESIKGEGDIEIEQVQSDWNQNDSSKKDFIKNKPTIPVVPTNVSEFNNDAGYINDVSNKQDVLVSGTNIKTINNQSLLGSGNIDIQGGGGSQVQSDWNQTDTSEPDYIKNKPTIPDAQIQSDWNQSDSTKVDYIKNKPTIPDVSGKADKATTLEGYGITDAKIESGVITLGSNTITPVTDVSGKQDKIDSSHKLSADLISDGSTNKVFTATEQSKLSGIATGAEVNVQANWNESDSSSDAYIQNKPTIPDVSNCIQKSNTAGLVKNDGTIDTSTYLTSSTAHQVPSGGNAGQVLKKKSNTDYDTEWGAGGGGASYTPTLNSAPTSSTTTYVKDGETVDFEVGQFARVANGNGWDMYQLYDVTNGAATWEKCENIHADHEDVFIVVTTDVQGVSVSGLVINAYYNGSTAVSASVTTDAQGMASLQVPNGYQYKLVFPDIAGCKSIEPIVHTATVAQRSIEVEYVEQPQLVEAVTVELSQILMDVYTPLSGKTVSVTSGGTTTTYTTDAQGKVQFEIAIGTQYTVTAPQIEDKYIRTGGYTRTYVAERSVRVLNFIYRTYDSGLFVVASDGAEYALNDWETAVAGGTRQNSEAKLIKVATAALIQAGGVFYFDIDDMRNKNYEKKTWESQNILLSSIPQNGNSASSNYYYDGYTASTKIQEECTERGLQCAATSHCLERQYTGISGATLKGFLGSIGQWQVMWSARIEIDEILQSVRPNGTYLLSGFTDQKWSSSQYSANGAWFWSSTANYTNKNSSYFVVPFFAY